MKYLKLIENSSEIKEKDYDVIYFNKEANGLTYKEESCVDLGLPSKTLWMTCNIGATAETDCGLYFQFGSVSGDELKDAKSTWNYAPFNNGYDDYNAMYFESIMTTVMHGTYSNILLNNEYDAVYQATNGGAQMPTSEDINELINNTRTRFVENYKDSGVNGMLFTSIKNEKTLFIPFGGYKFTNQDFDFNSCGYLWSKNLNHSLYSNAEFLSVDMNSGYLDKLDRCCAFNIRGVSK